MTTKNEPDEKEESLIEWYDSFQDMFQFFCNNTTIHGTIRLVCSSRNKMKTVFWAVLFLVSLGTLYWQFAFLTGQYWSYPVTVNIMVQSNPKMFPAVTVCNMDPYRFDLVKEHLNQLDQLTQETLSSLYGYNSSSHLWNGSRITQLEDLLDSGHVDLNASFHLDTKTKLMRLKDDNSGPALPGMNSSKVGFQLCNATGADCFYKSYWFGVDALSDWYMYQFMNIMSQIPVIKNITNDEHMENFVYSCKYKGKGCQTSEYVQFHHSVYGRCYTFNSEGKGTFWTATAPGMEYGLSLIVKAKEKNHWPLLLSTAGVRVMIHNRNQPLSMEQEVLEVRPGTQMSIGIRQDEIHRLGGVYGQCTADGNDVEVKLLYNTPYSRQACLHSCFQDKMVQQCGCGYYFYPLPPGAEYCNYNRHPGWGHCYYRLHQDMMDQRLICIHKCPMPCHEHWCKLSVGSTKWPSSKSEWWARLPLLKAEGRNASNKTRKDISKINVYYQKLSYQSIHESPAISVTTMLSNMGNNWSFWFGSSVLSVVELGELLLDSIALLLIFLYRRFQAPKVDTEQSYSLSSISSGLEDCTAVRLRTVQTCIETVCVNDLPGSKVTSSPASGRIALEPTPMCPEGTSFHSERQRESTANTAPAECPGIALCQIVSRTVERPRSWSQVHETSRLRWNLCSLSSD
ncbi:epithelial sodium channel subunit delta [Microcaecilia unicolor]|uniref:Amiloride-sensitive sodium channel subunit delta n=1 Tax=Microcaecilia unicolor TaxID=1415580 RepID=A0A6P7ZVC7_9AMPH|nr:amiloride-sensitive sodium channel subunit delta [Microcaecilia unicolor]